MKGKECTFNEFFELGGAEGGDVGGVLGGEAAVVVVLFEGVEVWGEDEVWSHEREERARTGGVFGFRNRSENEEAGKGMWITLG